MEGYLKRRRLLNLKNSVRTYYVTDGNRDFILTRLPCFRLANDGQICMLYFVINFVKEALVQAQKHMILLLQQTFVLLLL
jgi:hypothetical protein